MKNFAGIFIGSVLVFSAGYFFINTFNTRVGDELIIYFLDVGQGDAVFIQTPSGNNFLIDSGFNNLATKNIFKYINWFERSIGGFLITHSDTDHAGGAPSIFSSFKVENLFLSNIYKQTPLIEEINKLAVKERSNLITVEEEDRIVLDHKNNIYFEVLSPSNLLKDSEVNDRSVVLKLIYKNTSIIFTGDASIGVEKYLVSVYGENLNSDILKVGHHGSKTSTSEEFIGFVSPKYAIISAGKENDFGHPHQEVLDILNSFEVQVLQTKDRATIVARSDGNKLWIED